MAQLCNVSGIFSSVFFSQEGTTTKVSWRTPTHTSKSLQMASCCLWRSRILGKMVRVVHVSDNKHYITDCVGFFIRASGLSLSDSSWCGQSFTALIVCRFHWHGRSSLVTHTCFRWHSVILSLMASWSGRYLLWRRCCQLCVSSKSPISADRRKEKKRQKCICK